MTESEPIKREIEIAPAAASFTLSLINNKANGNAYILQMVALVKDNQVSSRVDQTIICCDKPFNLPGSTSTQERKFASVTYIC